MDVHGNGFAAPKLGQAVLSKRGVFITRLLSLKGGKRFRWVRNTTSGLTSVDSCLKRLQNRSVRKRSEVLARNLLQAGEDYHFLFKLAIIARKLSKPASKFSTISKANTSGSGRLSRSAKDLSFSQVMSKEVLSRAIISS